MLKGQKVYLDLRDYPLLEKLESDIRFLGATVEKFLSRETTYVITSREKAVRQKTAPQRVCSPTQRLVLGEGEKICSSAFSRGQKLLMRSNSLNSNSMPTGTACDPVQFAVTWNIPIVSIESLLKAIRSSVPQTTGVPGEKVGKCRKREIRTRKLTGAYIKIEDVDCRYRPFYGELPSMPYVNVHPVAAESVFSVVSKKQVPQPEAVKKTSRNPATKKERGYCECCDVYYSDVKEHLREPSHRLFAQNKINFDRLDALTSELSLVSSVAGSSCDFFLQEFVEDGASDSRHIMPCEAVVSLPESRSMSEVSDLKIQTEYTPCVTSKLLSEDILDASGSTNFRDLSVEVPVMPSEDMVDGSGPSSVIKDLRSGMSGLISSPGIMVSSHTEFEGNDSPIHELLTVGASNVMDFNEEFSVMTPKPQPHEVVNASSSKLLVSNSDFLTRTSENVLNSKTSPDFNQDLSAKNPGVSSEIIALASDSNSIVQDLRSENQQLLTDAIANSFVSKESINDRSSKNPELLSEILVLSPSLKCASGDSTSGHLKLPNEIIRDSVESIEIIDISSSRTPATLFKSILAASGVQDVVSPHSATLELLSENVLNFVGSKNEELTCKKTELLHEAVSTMVGNSASNCANEGVRSITHDILFDNTNNRLDAINCESLSEKIAISNDVIDKYSCENFGTLLECKKVVSCSNDKSASPETVELMPLDRLENILCLKFPDQNLPSCAPEIQSKNEADALCSQVIVHNFPVEAQDLKEFPTASGVLASDDVKGSPSVTHALHSSPPGDFSVSKLACGSSSETMRVSQHDNLDNGLVLESIENNSLSCRIQTEACQSVENVVQASNCDDVLVKPACILEQVMTEEAMEIQYEALESVNCCSLEAESAAETKNCCSDVMVMESIANESTRSPQATVNVMATVEHGLEEETVNCCISKVESAAETNYVSAKVMMMKSELHNCLPLNTVNTAPPEAMEFFIEPVVCEIEKIVDSGAVKDVSAFETEKCISQGILLEPDCRNCPPLRDASITIPLVIENLTEPVVCGVEEELIYCRGVKNNSPFETEYFSADARVIEPELQNCSKIHDTVENVRENAVPKVLENVYCGCLKVESAADTSDHSANVIVLEPNYRTKDVNTAIHQAMESAAECNVDDEMVNSRILKLESASVIDNLHVDPMMTESERQNCSPLTLTFVNISVPQVMESLVERVVDEVEEMVESCSSTFEIYNLSMDTVVTESERQSCLPLTDVVAAVPGAIESFKPTVDKVEKLFDCHSPKFESDSVINSIGASALLMESYRQNCTPSIDVSSVIPRVMELHVEPVVDKVNEGVHKSISASEICNHSTDALMKESECKNSLPSSDVGTIIPHATEKNPILPLSIAEIDETNESEDLTVEALDHNFTAEMHAVERITADVQMSCAMDTLPTSSLLLPVFPSFEMCSSEGSRCSEDSDLISSDRVDNILAFLSGSHSDSLCSSSDGTMPLSPGYLPTADAGGVGIQVAHSLSALDQFENVLKEPTQHNRGMFEILCDEQLMCRTILVLDNSEYSANFENQQDTSVAGSSAVCGVIANSSARILDENRDILPHPFVDNSETVIADNSVDTRSYSESHFRNSKCNDGDGDHYLSLSDISSAVECDVFEPVVYNDPVQVCQTEIVHQAERGTAVSLAVSSAIVSDDPCALTEQSNECNPFSPVHHFHAKDQEDFLGMPPVEQLVAADVKNVNGSSSVSSNNDEAEHSVRTQFGQQEFLRNVAIAMENALNEDNKSSTVNSYSFSKNLSDEGQSSPAHRLQLEESRIAFSNFDGHQQFTSFSVDSAEWSHKPATDSIAVSIPNQTEVVLAESDVLEQTPIDVCGIHSNADIISKAWSRDPALSAFDVSELSDKTDIYSPSISLKEEEAEGFISELVMEHQGISVIDTREVEHMDYTSVFQPACQATNDLIELQMLGQSTMDATNTTNTGCTRFFETPKVNLNSCSHKMKKSDLRSQFRNISASPYKSIANHANDVVRELELLERLAAGLVGERTSTETSKRPLNIGVHDALLSLAGGMEFDKPNVISVFESSETTSDRFEDRTQLPNDSVIDDDFFSKLLQDCDNIPDVPTEPYPFVLHSPKNSSVETCFGIADSFFASNASPSSFDREPLAETDSEESLIVADHRTRLNSNPVTTKTPATQISAVSCSAESVSHSSKSRCSSYVKDFLPASCISDSCKQGLRDSASSVPSVESKICSRANDSAVWQVQTIIGLRMRLKKVMEKSVQVAGSGNISKIGWQARRRSSNDLKLVITMPRVASTDQMRIC